MKNRCGALLLSLVLSLTLCVPMLAVPAKAAQLPALPDFTFASGAGGWFTTLSIHTDGTFEGMYRASGWSGNDRVVYRCNFTGRVSGLKQVDEYTWSMQVESLNTQRKDGERWTEDGTIFIGAGPHGMPPVGGELRLYLPGHPSSSLTKDFLSQVANTGTGVSKKALTSFALYNVSGNQGFGSSADQSAPLLSQWQSLGKTAYASTQEIEVDGRKVTFEAYALKDANGNDTNYIKLRDVASVLNGTSAQFQVGWNGSVTIITGQPYTPNGSEMSTPYSGNRPIRTPPPPTLVNGAQTNLSAILLTDDNENGYTYYKLRDLGEALGFTVDWTAERGIFIETN